MLIVACMGLGVNLTLAFFLHPPHAPGHLHHDHASSSLEEGKTGHGHAMNINVKAALIHVIGDMCFSLGVLISAIVIVVDPTKMLIDPLCTFLFSGIVIATTLGLVRDSVHVLMEGKMGDIKGENDATCACTPVNRGSPYSSSLPSFSYAPWLGDRPGGKGHDPSARGLGDTRLACLVLDHE